MSSSKTLAKNKDSSFAAYFRRQIDEINAELTELEREMQQLRWQRGLLTEDDLVEARGD